GTGQLAAIDFDVAPALSPGSSIDWDLALVDVSEGDHSWNLLIQSITATYGSDFNRDGTVDGDDLAIWESGWGSETEPHTGGDASGDGRNDGFDFLTWQRQRGEAVAPAAGSSVVLQATAAAPASTRTSNGRRIARRDVFRERLATLDDAFARHDAI
ncbi:MAG: hypothetical protein KDA61_06025, partial [Planctomycetales bacterium]|nr:hypothetical protein [Planctomycetales bacterium]